MNKLKHKIKYKLLKFLGLHDPYHKLIFYWTKEEGPHWQISGPNVITHGQDLERLYIFSRLLSSSEVNQVEEFAKNGKTYSDLTGSETFMPDMLSWYDFDSPSSCSTSPTEFSVKL